MGFDQKRFDQMDFDQKILVQVDTFDQTAFVKLNSINLFSIIWYGAVFVDFQRKLLKTWQTQGKIRAI
jgi:hypothetical protein